MYQELFSLAGRNALITGGSRGMGKEMARGFADAGANVVIASHEEEELGLALDELRTEARTRIEMIVADLSRREQTEMLARKAIEKMGRIDILVNNAGINVPQAIDKIQDEHWDRILEVNLSSCMTLTRALVPQMRDNGWGRIIYIASIWGFASVPGRSTYSATKAALIGMARPVAIELGHTGITVNCIAPGPMLTDMPKSMLSREELDAWARAIVLGRWGNPKEIVGPALLLASEAGSFITGSTIVVDGGLMARGC